MRDAIGGAWLTGLIITFTLIFVAYLTVMITYSTAFKMKNETVNIIEKYEGLSKNGSVKIINQYLSNSGYNGEGRCECESDWGCYGARNLSDSSSSLVKINNNNIKEDYFYCVQYHSKGENSGYYDIQLF